MNAVATQGLAAWMAYFKAPTAQALSEMLHEDAVFHSPIVHTPQRGKAITHAYLSAADKVLANDTFTYVGTHLSSHGAVLEFTCKVDGISVNGIDMISWDDDGKITEFKVMVRPLQAVNKVHAMMKEMLENMRSSG